MSDTDDTEESMEYTQTENTNEVCHNVIRHFMDGGKEKELYEWLKERGILRSYVRCKHNRCEAGNGFMQWTKCRVIDSYAWKCASSVCPRVQIRDSSFFMKLKGEIKLLVAAIVKWCEKTPSLVTCHATDTEYMNLLWKGLKEVHVTKLYNKCMEVASRYIVEHQRDWVLGGIDVVLLVDIFPDGYMAQDICREVDVNKSKRILCIADTSVMPAKVWLQHLPNKKEESLMELISRHVRPGSTLVVNEKLGCPRLQEETGFCCICVERLQCLDSPGCRSIQENLETIWKSTVHVCKEVQNVDRREVLLYLHEYMWRQLFASNPSVAMENLLDQIAEQYNGLNTGKTTRISY